jgi:hypothetical protein
VTVVVTAAVLVEETGAAAVEAATELAAPTGCVSVR